MILPKTVSFSPQFGPISVIVIAEQRIIEHFNEQFSKSRPNNICLNILISSVHTNAYYIQVSLFKFDIVSFMYKII